MLQRLLWRFLFRGWLSWSTKSFGVKQQRPCSRRPQQLYLFTRLVAIPARWTSYSGKAVLLALFLLLSVLSLFAYQVRGAMDWKAPLKALESYSWEAPSPDLTTVELSRRMVAIHHSDTIRYLSLCFEPDLPSN